MRVGQEPLGTLSVVLDQVDRRGDLQAGLLPRLPRLPLEQLRDALIVVEQPVTQAPEPVASAGRSERLPSRLVAPQSPDGGAHVLDAVIGQGGDHGAIRGRPHLEVRSTLRAAPRRPRSDLVRARGPHLGVARPHQCFMVSRHGRQCQSTRGRTIDMGADRSERASPLSWSREISPPTRSIITLAIALVRTSARDENEAPNRPPDGCCSCAISDIPPSPEWRELTAISGGRRTSPALSSSFSRAGGEVPDQFAAGAHVELAEYAVQVEVDRLRD